MPEGLALPRIFKWLKADATIGQTRNAVFPCTRLQLMMKSTPSKSRSWLVYFHIDQSHSRTSSLAAQPLSPVVSILRYADTRVFRSKRRGLHQPFAERSMQPKTRPWGTARNAGSSETLSKEVTPSFPEGYPICTMVPSSARDLQASHICG